MLDQIVLGKVVQEWIYFFGLGTVVFFALLLLRKLIQKRIRPFSVNLPGRVDELLYATFSSTRIFFLGAIALYVSSFYLGVASEQRLVLSRIFIVLSLLQCGIWGNRAISFWIQDSLKNRNALDATTSSSLGVVSFILRFALYVLLFLLAVHNLGFNITTLIAGLGVGGIAIALAVQNILGDLFASLTIILDKPFVIGDFIVVNEFMGTIEHIGLKTTRIRSLSGEQIIFSNSDLLGSRIRNFKRMNERRVVISIGVTYQTPAEKIRTIPAAVARIIEGVDQTRFERCHFLRFSSSSLDLETVYWVKSPDFNDYAKVAQEINLKILEHFKREGIEFAYPTQTVFLERSAAN